MLLKPTLFSISSYPSPNSEHSTTITVYWFVSEHYFYKPFQTPFRYVTLWLKNLSCLPSTHRVKCNSPVWLSRTFTILTIVALHLYLLLRKRSLVWPSPSPVSQESHVQWHLMTHLKGPILLEYSAVVYRILIQFLPIALFLSSNSTSSTPRILTVNCALSCGLISHAQAFLSPPRDYKPWKESSHVSFASSLTKINCLNLFSSGTCYFSLSCLWVLASELLSKCLTYFIT